MQIEMTEMNTISSNVATTVTGITITAMLIAGSLSSPEEMVVIKKFCIRIFYVGLNNILHLPVPL